MFSLQAEEVVQLMLAELGADDAQSAGVVGGAIAHLVLLGHIVKVQPLAALGADDALGAQDGTVFTAVQRRQDALDLALGEHLHRLRAPAGEHLVGVVMVMVMVVAATGAMLIMLVVMMLVMVLMVMVFMAAFVMVMMLMVFMAALLIVVMVLVLMVVAAAGAVLAVVVVMVVVLMFFVLMAHGSQKLVRQRHLLHGAEDGLAVDLIPGGGPLSVCRYQGL